MNDKHAMFLGGHQSFSCGSALVHGTSELNYFGFE